VPATLKGRASLNHSGVIPVAVCLEGDAMRCVESKEKGQTAGGQEYYEFMTIRVWVDGSARRDKDDSAAAITENNASSGKETVEADLQRPTFYVQSGHYGLCCYQTLLLERSDSEVQPTHELELILEQGWQP